MHKWFGYFVFLFVIATFLSGIYDQHVMGLTTSEYMSYVIGYKVESINDIGILSVINPFSGLWTKFIPKLMTWDYFFLQGQYSWLRTFVLAPASGIFILGMITIFSQTLFGFFRR